MWFGLFCFVLFFPALAALVAYGSSWARDQICHSWGNAGSLTHCTRPVIKLVPPQRRAESLTHCITAGTPKKCVLSCDVAATKPLSVDVMDYVFTCVPARCPRAIRVVGICQSHNVRKAFIFGIPPATLFFEFVCFQH